MASVIAKYILKESEDNSFGLEDPHFEQVPATRLHKRAFSRKKHRKAVPSGLLDHDGKILTKVGDAFNAFMAFMVLRICCQVEGGLPLDVQLKMWINILLDFVVGLAPFVGNIIDALFRANTRNAVELEKFLRKRGAASLKALGHSIPIIDPSDSIEYDRFHDEEGKP